VKNDLAEDILGKRGAVGNCSYEEEEMKTSLMSKRMQETALTKDENIGYFAYEEESDEKFLVRTKGKRKKAMQEEKAQMRTC